jgi:hypothetical protein
MESTNKAQTDRLNTILVQSLCEDRAGSCWKIKQIETSSNMIGGFEQIIVYLIDKSGLFTYYIIDANGNAERRRTDVL